MTYARHKNKVARGAFVIVISYLIQISFSVKDEEFMIRSKKKFKQHVQHAFLCRTLRLFLLHAVSPWRQLEPTMQNSSFFIAYVKTA